MLAGIPAIECLALAGIGDGSADDKTGHGHFIPPELVVASSGQVFSQRGHKHHPATRIRHMLHDIRVPCNALSEVPAMAINRRSALLSALLLTPGVLASVLPAAAQTVAQPREAQVGPRPFYLVDKMKDGP